MNHIVTITHQGGPAFSPENLAISVGDTVTWRNTGPMVHTATRFDEPPFDTGDIEGGADSQPIQFDTVGELPYFCVYHDFMTGSVTVA